MSNFLNMNNSNYDIWNPSANYHDMGFNDDTIPSYLSEDVGQQMSNWDTSGGNAGVSPAMDSYNEKFSGGGGGWDTLGKWGNLAMGAADVFMKWQNHKLRKEMFESGKDMWNANYAANRTTTNADIMARQAARLGASGGAGGYNSMASTRENDTVKAVNV